MEWHSRDPDSEFSWDLDVRLLNIAGPGDRVLTLACKSPKAGDCWGCFLWQSQCRGQRDRPWASRSGRGGEWRRCVISAWVILKAITLEDFLPGRSKPSEESPWSVFKSAWESIVGGRAGPLWCQRAAASGKGVAVSLRTPHHSLMWGGASICAADMQKASPQNTRSSVNRPFIPCPSSPSWPCGSREWLSEWGRGPGRRDRMDRQQKQRLAHYWAGRGNRHVGERLDCFEGRSVDELPIPEQESILSGPSRSGVSPSCPCWGRRRHGQSRSGGQGTTENGAASRPMPCLALQ